MRSLWAAGIGLWLAVVPLPTGAGAGGASDDPDRAAELRMETAVIAAIEAKYNLELRSEEPLRRAARDLNMVRATGLDVDPHEFLRQAFSTQGVLDPFPYVFYGTAPAAKLDEFVGRLLVGFGELSGRERRLYTHVAAAVETRSTRRNLIFRERKAWITIVLTQRSISFSPLPEIIVPGDRYAFEGEIHPPFREPEVLLTRPDGEVVTLNNLANEGTSFRCWLRFDAGHGEYQLEVLGRDDMGPRVLGLCSLYAQKDGKLSPHEQMMAAARSGTLAAPAAHRAAVTDPLTDSEAEQRMLELIARDRKRAGVSVLQSDPMLTAMARAHSRDMADNDFFAHISPRTGRLSERAERIGLKYRRLTENIALHADVEEAEAALLRSPGHRSNLLDPEFTHVGVGVATVTDKEGNLRVYVTQNFMIPWSAGSR